MRIRSALLVIFLLVTAASVAAFHRDGVARCDACHTIHNSENGLPVNPQGPAEYGLRYESATEVCLSCHATNTGAVWGTNPLSPPPEHGAGNFVFLQEDNINDAPDGAQHPLAGFYAGHSVIAPSRNAGVDPAHAAAPGGSYPSSALSCTSCHDPHGNTNFRMLYGVGIVPAGNFFFVNPAPEATGIDPAGVSESPANHTAYRSGMSAWCANCHGVFHHSSSGFEHPSDESIGGDQEHTYNVYNGSADPDGGTFATAYLPQVPFEDPSSTISMTHGPSADSRVSCITCHRAHASSGPDIGRWDFNTRYVNLDGTPSGSWPIPSPYGAASQYQLCDKCHANDTQDHGHDNACISCHRQPNLRLLKLNKR